MKVAPPTGRSASSSLYLVCVFRADSTVLPKGTSAWRGSARSWWLGCHPRRLLHSQQPPLPCDQHLLFPPVPPSKPTVNIPSSATIGSPAVLTCLETDGSPPSQYHWYRDGVPMPLEPKSSRAFSNSSYSLNPQTGELVWRGEAGRVGARVQRP